MKNIIKLFGFMLLGSVIIIGLLGCKENSFTESRNNLMAHNGTEITTYSELVKHLKLGDKFLVKYYINRDYTEKTLKVKKQGLKNVSNSLYIHHFSNGVLANTGDVIFNGSKDWQSNNILFHHTYKYEFMPNNQVKISGKDVEDTYLESLPFANYNLIGHLGKSVIIYAYS